MIKKMSILLLFLVGTLAGSWAQDEKKSKAKTEDKVHKGSAELERIKSLAGEWRGNSGSRGDSKFKLLYTVLAGGSVVMERIAGTETVTMYHDDKAGQLVMTRYGFLENRPHLKLKASDEKTISMELDPSGEIDGAKEGSNKKKEAK